MINPVWIDYFDQTPRQRLQLLKFAQRIPFYAGSLQYTLRQIIERDLKFVIEEKEGKRYIVGMAEQLPDPKKQDYAKRYHSKGP